MTVPERKATDRAVEHQNFAFELKLATDDSAPAGTIEGYGAVFADSADHAGDIILPGAFRQSLGEWKRRKVQVPMLWQHDSWSPPIGAWTELAEDDKGLRVKGRLVLDVAPANEIYALIKAGALHGLSIGYRTREAAVDPKTGVRTLKRVELWEISVVTFPAMPGALLDGAKAGAGLINPRELEDDLREAGFSRTDAPKAIRVFREHLQREAGDPDARLREGARDVLMTLRKAAERFRA